MLIVVLGVVGPEMAMDSRFHKVEPMLGERAAHGQPTACLGIVKNSLCLLDWTKKKCPCVICIILLKNEWLEIWVEVNC